MDFSGFIALSLTAIFVICFLSVNPISLFAFAAAVDMSNFETVATVTHTFKIESRKSGGPRSIKTMPLM